MEDAERAVKKERRYRLRVIDRMTEERRRKSIKRGV